MMILPRLAANSDDDRPPNPQSDLTFWCEAAVRDRLTAFYFTEMGDTTKAGLAARLHWTIWRSYFNELSLKPGVSRQALANLLADVGLRRNVLDSGDALIIDEIADLIFQRFRRAPLHAKTYAKCLVAAAARMGQARN